MRKIKLVIFLLFASFWTSAQSSSVSSHATQRLSYFFQLDFQGFSFPASGIKTYLQNKGLSIGASYRWNLNNTLQQNFKVGTFFNKFHGSTWHTSTALQYNPLHSNTVTAGISLGVGYMQTYTPANGWVQNKSGKWAEKANKAGLLFVPAGVEIGVKAFENQNCILMPTISYGVNAVFNYSPAMPILPQSIFSLGSKLKLK